MKKSDVLVLIPIVALLLLINSQINTQAPFQKWVWFVWFINYFSSLLIIIGFAVAVFFQKSSKDYKTVFRYLFLLIPISLGHFVIGALLSVFVKMEPLDFFGPNGFINHFEISLFFEKFGFLPSVYWLYLASKVYLLNSKNSQKLSLLTYLADPFLLLMGSIGVLLLSSDSKIGFDPLAYQAFISSCLIVLVFIQWRRFFNNDVGSLIDDQEAHVKPDQNILPMTITVKGAKGWGLIFVIFGFIFISVSLGICKFILQSFESEQYGSAVGLIIGMLFFLCIGLLFLSVGLNLNWAYKVFKIDSQTIHFEQKIFIPWPLLKKWTVPRFHYQVPEKVVRHSRSTRGPGYKVYKIILRLKPEHRSQSRGQLIQSLFSSNEVLLYEAYFEKSFDENFDSIKKALS